MIISKFIKNEADMISLGKTLASCSKNEQIIFLSGALGAGKTTLVRGFLRASGYVETVRSPTYTLVESYHLADKLIHHFDFYRIQNFKELEFLGLADYLKNDAICLIEWPEHAQNILPEPTIRCTIHTPTDLVGRVVEFSATSDEGIELILCCDRVLESF